MKVIVCGAGQVGSGIARQLSNEHNDVTVIDNSPDLIQQMADNLDVRTVVGYASHPDVLERAGAREADMVIAVTFADEVNMVACQVAHSIFNVPTKIARIRAQSYLRPMWQDLFTRDHMPIDVIISPELEVGRDVMRRLEMPGALEAIPFGDTHITFLGIALEDDCPVVNTPLRQLTELFPDLNAVVTGIQRGERLFVPDSEDQMMVGDVAYVVTDTTQSARVLSLFGHEEQAARRVVIVGAGNIGRHVAAELENSHTSVKVKIIEADKEKAVLAADELSRTVVLNGDALDEEVLREAGASQAETILALTNDDKVNILSCVMAKQLGCERSVSLINNRGYSGLINPMGVDAFVNPRATTVSTVLRHVRRGRIRGVSSVQDGKAEVIEAEALATSTLVGRPLRDADLPSGIRLGAVLRGTEVIVPRGDTEIQAGDRVIIFAMADEVRRVERMFRVSIEFF
ncbi:Trk system potassium uptake protein TrkA [Candidatus Phaeomarinobacter ectocarpi]|uniref:Trk system potassium uptake protein TrkA n=1 Tax=Candidatus Phaeomarinibacter ectocarpi TaxID=1458461 RepID=X5MHB6_9HYPH|nr:Trk system potassium transporter TrkA [Candidatus Phaeomarinobacter ectocarpi]CDO61074.1 Trk system potassium uptake protein TrkA [Candidatus Phaeomarinobacter ectocarpi]